VRVEELDLRELLELDPGGGLVRFAGQRALIFDAVAQGLLRKELIDTFGLRVARILLAEAALHMKQPVEGLSAQAADHLLGYSWPGNVRELANVMERGVAVAQKSRIALEDLPPEVRSSPPSPDAPFERPLREMEQDYILAILESKGGNRTQAALTLGIGKATLHRKLKSYKNSRPISHPAGHE